MFVREQSQRLIRFSIELYQNNIPDVYNVMIVLVNQMGGISISNSVVVKLDAMSAWTLVSRLQPETLATKLTPWIRTTLDLSYPA